MRATHRSDQAPPPVPIEKEICIASCMDSHYHPRWSWLFSPLTRTHQAVGLGTTPRYSGGGRMPGRRRDGRGLRG